MEVMEGKQSRTVCSGKFPAQGEVLRNKNLFQEIDSRLRLNPEKCFSTFTVVPPKPSRRESTSSCTETI
jgi:hypothetical protein